MAKVTQMKAGLEAWRTPEEGEAIPGAVLTEWVGIGLLVLLFATVLAGIWMALVHGMVLPSEAICLRG